MVLQRPLVADHPATDGHFPGRPIVPGAVLLDEVLTAVADACGLSPRHVCIEQAKFLRPLAPGSTLTIECVAPQDGVVRFRGLVAGQPALSGVIAFRASS
jgi:3-hydroxyacyl-[acyl-carrier-protein] dehydratase